MTRTVTVGVSQRGLTGEKLDGLGVVLRLFEVAKVGIIAQSSAMTLLFAKCFIFVS